MDMSTEPDKKSSKKARQAMRTCLSHGPRYATTKELFNDGGLPAVVAHCKPRAQRFVCGKVDGHIRRDTLPSTTFVA